MLQNETVTVKHTASSILREERLYRLQEEAQMIKYVECQHFTTSP